MKIKLSIKAKMLLAILSTTILVFAVVVGYISMKTSERAYLDAKKLLIEVADTKALTIKKDFSAKLEVVKTLSEAFTVYDQMPNEEWQNLFLKMYDEVFKNNPDIYQLWDSWEFNMIDTLWTQETGRYTVMVFEKDNKIYHDLELRSLDGDSEAYAFIKNTAQTMLEEPYWDDNVADGKKCLMTSIEAPVIKNKQYIGVIGLDIIIDKLQKLVEDIHPFEHTTVFLSSNLGVIVGHTNIDYLGKNISEIEEYNNQNYNLKKYIAKGKKVCLQVKGKTGDDNVLLLNPIQIGDYISPWSLCLMVPKKVILQEFYKTRLVSIIIAFIGLFLLSLVIVLTASRIGKSLIQTTSVLQKMSLGDVKELQKLSVHTGDEVEDMANSTNQVIDGLLTTAKFASEIGKGNLDYDFIPLSDRDLLGNSLLNMRQSLKVADNEENKRKTEDFKYNWATDGQAKFAEILRNSSEKIDVLSMNVISKLVEYMEVNQGAIFVMEEKNSEKVLVLKSALAYGRKKTIKKVVPLGKELVGRSALEQKTIYINNLPNEYINIQSGMGTDNPKVILIVPLVLNEEVLGVIELASFNNIEDYRIKFVERLAESIASTISTIKVNYKTAQLLEKSKQQSQELASQEEEMRQNMEELQSTQEEARRRESEMMDVLSAISSAFYIVEYDMNKRIIKISDSFAKLYGKTPDQIVGSKQKLLGYKINETNEHIYSQLWSNLTKGQQQSVESIISIDNKTMYLQEYYYPILDSESNAPYKIIQISYDITKQKTHSQDNFKIKQQIEDERKQIQLCQDEIAHLKEKHRNMMLINKKIQQKTNDEEEQSTAVINENELISWDNQFAIGIKSIDEQHKQIVQLLNVVYANFKQGKAKAEIKASLTEFINVITTYLQQQETYYKQFSYAKADECATEHKLFLQKINQFNKDYSANKIKFLDDIIEDIKQWIFVNVVTNTDYVKLFKQNGL